MFVGQKIQPNSKKNQQRTNSIVKKQSKKLAKTQPNSNKKTKQKSLLKFSAQYMFVNILHLWRSVSLLISYYCCFFFFWRNLLISCYCYFIFIFLSMLLLLIYLPIYLNIFLISTISSLLKTCLMTPDLQRVKTDMSGCGFQREKEHHALRC
jgi:magnesium-transporting ATPase (P-type)